MSFEVVDQKWPFTVRAVLFSIQVSCQTVLAFEVYFLASSLTWFILDNIDIALMTLSKPVTAWSAFGIFMVVGWGKLSREQLCTGMYK